MWFQVIRWSFWRIFQMVPFPALGELCGSVHQALCRDDAGGVELFPGAAQPGMLTEKTELSGGVCWKLGENIMAVDWRLKQLKQHKKIKLKAAASTGEDEGYGQIQADEN